MPKRQFGIGIEAIVPAQFDTGNLTHGWEQWITSWAKQARTKLEATVQGWEDPPTFQIRGPYWQGDQLICDVYTGDERWLWANVGTKKDYIIQGGQVKALRGPIEGQQEWSPVGARKRIIRGPAKDGLLHFKPMTMAKTTPGQFSSRANIVRGEEWWVARQVKHPGVTPRGWTQMLYDELNSMMAASAAQKLRQGVTKMKSHQARPCTAACFRPGHGC